MKNVIVLPAKTGDICSFIPIAKHLFDTSGEQPFWIVHALHELILRGASYVRTHRVTFDIRRVDLALRLAESMKPDRIVNGATFGKFWKGPRDKPHNFLAWEVNGYGAHFFDLEKFPLVLDRRDAQRESELIARYTEPGRPTLLLCLSRAKGAPFGSHRVFGDSIKRRWQNHCRIVDLCEFRTARFYDLLGLMEKSALMICVDTAVGHLAAAVPGMKVISLVPDSIFLGAEMRFPLLRRVRYGEALAQLPQIHADIARVLG